MQYLSTRCYIPSFKATGLFVLRKMILRFLPYMGEAAMLVMWPRAFEQYFVPVSRLGFIWNLVTIGPVVSEEMIEIVTDNGRRQRWTRGSVYPISWPGTVVSGELQPGCLWQVSLYASSVYSSLVLGSQGWLIKKDDSDKQAWLFILSWR